MNLYKNKALKIFNAALRSVDPYMASLIEAARIQSLYREKKYKKLYIIGFGKAVIPMTRAVVEKNSEIISAGIAITTHGQESGTGSIGVVKIYEAGHPLPDETGLLATEEIKDLLHGLDDQTLVVCLISGGGSALLVSPSGGITLEEKQAATELFLKAGADIHELNAVRKHISDVKGGKLAALAYPAHVLSLILSDVIGDDPDVIASGPTAPDRTTYFDALKAIEKYDLGKRMPASVMKILNEGSRGILDETPKEGSPVFRKVENIIIGSNKSAIEAAATAAMKYGFYVTVLTTEMKGEARAAGRWLARQAIEAAERKKQRPGISTEKTPLCLISGGETTVTVTGNGLGGRNTELALAFAIEIEGRDDITFLSAGTDGADGPTDAAGAIIDGQTVAKAKAANLNPEAYLANNDSYSFLKSTGDLLVTGPTGTNVMDIQLILIGH